MSTEVWFFVGCILISAMIALVILLPWLKKNDDCVNNPLVIINVKNFKKRLTELEQDVKDGLINSHQYSHQKIALEKQLLQAASVKSVKVPVDKISKLFLFILIPALAIGLYLIVNKNNDQLFKLWMAQDKYQQLAEDLLTNKISKPPANSIHNNEDMQVLVNVMQTNVHQNAHDGQRWLKLAELFSAMNLNDSSSMAMARAYRLNPNDIEIASQYVKALFFSNGGILTAQIKKILNDILQKDPQNQTAQMMLILGETSAANYADALKWAHHLRQQIQTQPIAEAQKLKSLNSIDMLIKEIKNKQQTSSKP